MPRSLRLAVRSVLVTAVLVLLLVDAWSATLLPGRFALDLVGAVGPKVGRWSVFLSGAFYGLAALASVVIRGWLLPAGESHEA